MAEIEKIDINGEKIRVGTFGKGNRTFVILPGISAFYVTDSINEIERQYGVFSENFRVFVFDYRENPKNGLSVCDLACDIIASAEVLGIKSAVFCGVSFGGTVAMKIAEKRPEIVEKLILTSATSRLSEKERNLFSGFVNEYDLGDRKNLARYMANFVYSENFLNKNKEFFDKYFTNLPDENTLRIKMLSKYLISADSYIDVLKIQSPILVCASFGDKVFDCRDMDYISKLPNVKRILYPDTFGHAVYDENPDFIKDIFSFAEK